MKKILLFILSIYLTNTLAKIPFAEYKQKDCISKSHLCLN